MSFGTAIKTCFRKYADFNGRARRSEYWFFVLFINLISLPVSIVAAVLLMGAMFSAVDSRGYVELDQMNLGMVALAYIIPFVVMLPFILPSYAAAVRRLHDMGQSGWWILLNLAGLGIVPLVMCVMDSQPGDNAWGPNPKGQAAFMGYPPQATPPPPAS